LKIIQTIALMAKVAKDNNVALPVSFFEKSNKAYFNTIAMVDSRWNNFRQIS
jgi:hypothetical protein